MEFQVISLLLAHKKGNGEKYKKGVETVFACLLSVIFMPFILENGSYFHGQELAMLGNFLKVI